MEKFISNLESFKKQKITYQSIDLEIEYNNDQKKKYDKIPKFMPKFKDIKMENKQNKSRNETIIPMGEKYNLIKMVKEDSPNGYIIALLQDKIGIFDEIFKLGINDVMVGYLFYCLFPNEYIYDMDNNEWYKIDKYGIYQKDKNNILLKDQINKILLKELESEYIRRLENSIDEEKKSNLMKVFISIRRYLLKYDNKQSIINELSLLYKQSKIYEKFDNVNNYVLAFNNGVYDLKTDEFRLAKPEELITCTTGYDYKKIDESVIHELYEILKTIMPDPEELKYLLKIFSFGLIGDNLLEEIYIMRGIGRNGKGLLRDLISYTLGSYFDNAEIEYFSKTNGGVHAGAADPIMARKKNCRIVITTEPEGDVQLRIAKLKQISGRDPIQVRDLYKAPFNFVPKFKLFIQTNEKLVIDGSDSSAITDRLRLIDFPIRFVDNPETEQERKIDRNLKSKLNDIKYKLAFFEILKKHYLDFVKNDNGKLTIPTRIKKDTREYLEENDILKDFIDEKLEKTNNIKDIIKSSEMFNKFKDFDRERSKSTTTLTFKNKMIQKGFQFKRMECGSVYICVKYKEDVNKNDLDN